MFETCLASSISLPVFCSRLTIEHSYSRWGHHCGTLLDYNHISYRLWSSTLRKAPLRLQTRPVGCLLAAWRFVCPSNHFKTCSTGLTCIPHFSALVRTSVLLVGCFCCFTDFWRMASARVSWKKEDWFVSFRNHCSVPYFPVRSSGYISWVPESLLAQFLFSVKSL